MKVVSGWTDIPIIKEGGRGGINPIKEKLTKYVNTKISSDIFFAFY